MSNDFFSNIEKNNFIKDVLEKRLKKYGRMNYAYAVMNKRNTDNMMIISDMSDDIVGNYLNNRYQSIDPVIINVRRQISPLVWDKSLIINSQWKVRKVFDSFRSFQDISGHTFVLHDQNNNLVVLSLYADRFFTPGVDECIKQFKDEIQGLLIYIHEKLLYIYHEESGLFKHALSFREAEVLYWVSYGKTYPEVAGILKISVSTVKFHMGRIVKKMGVQNAKQAISLGIECNIVSPPLK